MISNSNGMPNIQMINFPTRAVSEYRQKRKHSEPLNNLANNININNSSGNNNNSSNNSTKAILNQNFINFNIGSQYQLMDRPSTQQHSTAANSTNSSQHYHSNNNSNNNTPAAAGNGGASSGFHNQPPNNRNSFNNIDISKGNNSFLNSSAASNPNNNYRNGISSAHQQQRRQNQNILSENLKNPGHSEHKNVTSFTNVIENNNSNSFVGASEGERLSKLRSGDIQINNNNFNLAIQN